jgi:hypothetical protein
METFLTYCKRQYASRFVFLSPYNSFGAVSLQKLRITASNIVLILATIHRTMYLYNIVQRKIIR